MDIVSTKKTKEKEKNVANTASINCHSKKVRDCKKARYFTYSFISDHTAIDHYHYLLSLCKTQTYNIKWKIMNFKKFVLKIVRVFISMT